MTMQEQTDREEYPETYETAVQTYQAAQLPTLYPGADRALLSHEQKISVQAYEDRYRESTETLFELCNLLGTRKLEMAHLAVTGIYIEDDVELEDRDDKGKAIIDPETGEAKMVIKDRTMIRTSAGHFAKDRPIITNEVYYSTTSPICKRFFKKMVTDFNKGHMGDFFEGEYVPVEVFNKVYNNGHPGIGLKVVEEL